MIRIRVELIAASTGQVTELARMYIVNDGTGDDPHVGNYDVEVLRGRSAEQLDRRTVQKLGKVRNYPRLRYHVWHLVALALHGMEYGVLR
jgi:hypothetical protein